MEVVEIKTEYIKLDQFLKLSNVVSMGSDAKMLILEGLIKVNGEVELRRGKKLYNDDQVQFQEEIFKIKSNQGV
ncbi:MAG: RNA-binding S4 domain-containing protein [Fusobacteria bacterium]|nr:RNA-binding S4 domain-containing protein [Fusobacteriota bacterium]